MAWLDEKRLSETYIVDGKETTLREMLADVPFEDWPEDEEDLKWLLFCFEVTDSV